MGRINMHLPDEIHTKLKRQAEDLGITFERYINNVAKIASDKGYKKFEEL